MRIRTPNSVRLSLMLVAALVLVGVARAQVLEYVGHIDDNTPSADYVFELQTGQSALIVAEATSGDLDTFISLRGPNGDILMENDDSDSTNSIMGLMAAESGTYTLTVTRYEFSNTSGDYHVTVEIGDSSVLHALESLRYTYSGEELIRDTEHFRIHYTLEGEDATSETYIEAAANSLELIYRIEIEEMGWALPPSDGERGGDSRFDVYIIDMLDDYGSGSLGAVSRDVSTVGDNPNTERVEERTGASFLFIENDFIEEMDGDISTDTVQSLMRATAVHEFFHAIEFGYDMYEIHDWYGEATATWMETAALEKDQDAVDYVEANYTYPEICFGTINEPTGVLEYGDWMFIQMLVDGYGQDVVRRLWEHIAEQEGFAALEALLEEYDTDIPTTLTRYRLKNLVRDYQLAPQFNATVWLENSISTFGQWTFDGSGVQELGANYYEFVLPPGLYQVNLIPGDNTSLQLWAMGINGNQGQAISLGNGGTLSTGGYQRTYLMVFNPIYDEDVDTCYYSGYSIDVQPGSGTPLPPTETWNAQHFAQPIFLGEGSPVVPIPDDGKSNL